MRSMEQSVASDFMESSARPGFHTFNRRRATLRERPAAQFFRVRICLTLLGVLCVGYYAYWAGGEYISQRYENWVFDRSIARPAPAGASQPMPKLTEGQLIGRVSIGRLHLSAIVREGVSNATLNVAVGHVPSTALPGQPGNFAIAAHRDTLFRALQDIRRGDEVTLETDSGTYTYQVVTTKIVRPSDVSVLRADGGGLVSEPGQFLTMITCYPFRYIGSAPERFIVESKLISFTNGA